MDIQQYLNDIPTLIMTAFAALGGTATGIAALLSAVHKAIKTLRAGKNDYETKAIMYEEKASDLDKHIARLADAESTFQAYGDILSAFSQKLGHMTDQIVDIKAKYDLLAAAIVKIANNTPELVRNGTANSIRQLLAPDKAVCMEPIHIEVYDEIDG